MNIKTRVDKCQSIGSFGGSGESYAYDINKIGQVVPVVKLTVTPNCKPNVTAALQAAFNNFDFFSNCLEDDELICFSTVFLILS